MSSDRKTPPGRYLPARPFPPYAYVPGQGPHPVRDPAGHSHGDANPAVSAVDPAAWRDCPVFLYGVDLFNHGYFWEAHESWEALWHAYPAESEAAKLLQALIKLAAANVKRREGRPRGVERHAGKCRTLLSGLPPDAKLFGLTAAALHETLDATAAAAGSGAPHPPVPLYPD